MTSVGSEIWIVAFVAFAIGHFRKRRARQIGLALLIASPIIVLTVGLALVPPTLPSFITEWPHAMWTALPVFVTWLGLAILGYVAARWSVR